MKLIPHQNANSSVITVTNTATNLFSLMNTAGGVTNSQEYFTNVTLNGTGIANGVYITAEDGDVRYIVGQTPTSTYGNIISKGEKIFVSNVLLSSLKLIRTGSSNVTCSIDLYSINR